MADLEDLLRRSQDRLRGRPETRRDRAKDWWESRPDFVDMTTIAAAYVAAVAFWVGLIGGTGYGLYLGYLWSVGE